jgi:hypothetical protein
MIIGCDFHPDGSKFVGLHAEGDAERFYRQMPAPALIGMEFTGRCHWLVRPAGRDSAAS